MSGGSQQASRSQADAFAHLRADREEPWLHAVFVPPAGFDTVVAAGSVLVLGAGGAGKTALRLRLAHLAQQSPKRRLAAEWRLALQPETLTGSQLVTACLNQVFVACAVALLQFLGEQPHTFAQAPIWARDTLRWYLHHYLRGSWERQVDRIGETATAEGAALLPSLFATPAPSVIDDDAPPEQVINELATAVQRLGFAGIWVLVDGLEPWVQAEPAAVTRTLRAFFSALAIFETRSFEFKVMAPLDLATTLADVSGVARNRIVWQRLEWEPAELTAIVERRLAAMTGCTPFELSHLGDSTVLQAWLHFYGGSTPRGWLYCLRPLAEAYRRNASGRALTADECTTLLRRQPPPLYIDLAQGRVVAGNREVEDLQPASLKLLRYLYEQRPRRCSRNEIYYRGYLGLDHEPRVPSDADYAAPSLWNGILDSAIYRLRQAIEIDPKHPIYILTQRDKGVQLSSTW